MVAAGEAPDDDASAHGAVNGGADNGGAEVGIGGENMAPLLSRLAPLPLVVADGDD